jgi:hypothetical protein
MLMFNNGKSYIGVTRKTPEGRFRQHAKRAGTGSCRALSAAWKELGAPELTVLAEVVDDELHAAEVLAIDIFETMHPKGYNLTAGGIGGPVSDDTKRTLSAQRRADPKLRESMRKLHEGNTGREHTEASRKNMSAAQKGREVTEAAREKARATLRAKPDYIETCEKLHTYSSTLVHTQATKDQIRRTLLSRPDHEAHAAKLRTLRTGSVTSEATRAKQRASALARAARKRRDNGE